MRAMLTLPENYHEYAFWQATTRRRMLFLNLLGMGLLFVGLFIFMGWWLIVARLRQLNSGTISSDMAFSITLLASLILLTPLHEWCHGLAIQFYGLEPRYGFKPLKGVAFATPRNGYLWRNQYLVVLLAPAMLISLLAIALITILPLEFGLIAVLNAGVNIASAVGDFWMSGVAARQPATTIVRDEEDGMRFFGP